MATLSPASPPARPKQPLPDLFEKLRSIPQPSSQPISARMNRPFHVQMACTCIALSLFAVFGCKLMQIKSPDAISATLGLFILFLVTLPLLAYWKQKQKVYLLESALAIEWAVLLKVLLGYAVVIAARLGMQFSLKDADLARWDRLLGWNVAQLSAWAPQHSLGQIANQSYTLLAPLIIVAILLPVLTGRMRDTQKFLLANVIAFALSLPVFAVVPAIGPWYGLHFAPSDAQLACQNAFVLIRQPGPIVFKAAGIMCFPSFHAIWAVLCAYALYGMRWLRIPAMLLSSLIVFSTVSTGWHYFSDVLCGVAFAALSILIANWLIRLGDLPVASTVPLTGEVTGLTVALSSHQISEHQPVRGSNQ